LTVTETNMDSADFGLEACPLKPKIFEINEQVVSLPCIKSISLDCVSQ